MNIYEFITPSDPITFLAENDKVAFLCAVLVGNGKAGCRSIVDGEETSIPSILMFEPDVEVAIEEFLGRSLNSFLEKNKEKVQGSLKSFMYGSVEDREVYDDAVEAITDEEKLKKFKSKHEDRNRTSISAWVKRAWTLADKI